MPRAFDHLEAGAGNRSGNGASALHAGQRVLGADDDERGRVDVAHDRIEVERSIALDVTTDRGAGNRMAVHLVHDGPHRPVLERAPSKRVDHDAQVHHVVWQCGFRQPSPQVQHGAEVGVGRRRRRARNQAPDQLGLAGGKDHGHGRTQRVPDQVRPLDLRGMHCRSDVIRKIVDGERRAGIWRLVGAARVEQQAAKSRRQPAHHTRPGPPIGEGARDQHDFRPLADDFIRRDQLANPKVTIPPMADIPPPPPGTPPPGQQPASPSYSDIPYGPPAGSPGYVPQTGYSPLQTGAGIMSQFRGLAAWSVILGVVSVGVPIVTFFAAGGTVTFFYVLPIFGLIRGVQALTRGQVIGGGVGIVLNVIGGIISLLASGILSR